MGKLRPFMGKLRANYGLRFTHKILRGKIQKNLVKVWKNQVFPNYGKLWVEINHSGT